MSYYGSAYCVGGTGTFSRRQNFAHITCDVTHSSLRDTFPSQHLTFGQVGKALLRIKILCHPNMGSAKSNFDHRNSHFAGTLTVGAKSNSDHRNSYFAAILTVGAGILAVGAANAPAGGCTFRKNPL